MTGVVIRFPVYAARAIWIGRTESGQWQACFAGDAWTAQFSFEARDRWLVLREVRGHDVRCGLPIEDPYAPRFGFPKGFVPRMADDFAPETPDWSGGDAA